MLLRVFFAIEVWKWLHIFITYVKTVSFAMTLGPHLRSMLSDFLQMNVFSFILYYQRNLLWAMHSLCRPSYLLFFFVITIYIVVFFFALMKIWRCWFLWGRKTITINIHLTLILYSKVYILTSLINVYIYKFVIS